MLGLVEPELLAREPVLARGRRPEERRVVGRERDADPGRRGACAGDAPTRSRRRPSAGCSSARRRGSCPPPSSRARRCGSCAAAMPWSMRSGRSASRTSRTASGPGPLARVHRRAQSERPGAQVDSAERRRRDRGLVAADPEAHDRRQRHALVQVEHAVDRLGPPVPHAVEKDAAEDAVGLEGFAKPDVDRLEAGRGIQADPREDLGRDVDLGVAQAVGRRATPATASDAADVVLGPAEETADLGVEREEACESRTPRRAASNAAASAKACPARCARRDDLGRRKASLEVQVAIREEPAPRGRDVGDSGLSGFTIEWPPFTIPRHLTLYAPDPTARSLSRRARRAAVARCGRASLLTAVLWRYLPGGPAGDSLDLDRLRGRSPTGAFLLRDRRGGRARRWLALEARRPDGQRSGDLGVDPAEPAPASAVLEPLRRLAGPLRRIGAAPVRPAYGNPYPAVRMRDAAAGRRPRPGR